MPQVFHIEVFVARNQFLAVDAEGIYKEVQKIVGHGAVVYKTADGSYLAFFTLLFTCSIISDVLADSSISMSASREILMQ